jgi:hypothetical protein
MTYPTNETAVEPMMCQPRSLVLSECIAWKNTMNHPTTYGATVMPCALIEEKPRPLIRVGKKYETVATPTLTGVV